MKKKKAKEFVNESRRKMIQEIGAPAKSDANGQAEEAKCRGIYGSIRKRFANIHRRTWLEIQHKQRYGARYQR